MGASEVLLGHDQRRDQLVVFSSKIEQERLPLGGEAVGEWRDRRKNLAPVQSPAEARLQTGAGCALVSGAKPFSVTFQADWGAPASPGK